MRRLLHRLSLNFQKEDPDDYEQILANISLSISSKQTRLSEIRIRERRATLLVTLYAFGGWLLYLALWWTVLPKLQLWKYHSRDDRTLQSIIKAIPAVVGPVLYVFPCAAWSRGSLFLVASYSFDGSFNGGILVKLVKKVCSCVWGRASWLTASPFRETAQGAYGGATEEDRGNKEEDELLLDQEPARQIRRLSFEKGTCSLYDLIQSSIRQTRSMARAPLLPVVLDCVIGKTRTKPTFKLRRVHWRSQVVRVVLVLVPSDRRSVLTG